MELIECIINEEQEFPKLFASYAEMEYGLLFYNEKEKESYDSNHAIIYPDKITDFEAVISEIKDFYIRKEIVPRLYQPFVEGYFFDRKELLEKHGYNVEMYGKNKFMLLSEESTLEIQERLAIRRIKKWDERISLDVYQPSNEDYGIEVEKSSLKNENYYLFAGFLGNEIATIVAFHESSYGCTRFDYILTAPKHRGKGYAREILSYATDYCKQNGIKNCFQWPAHETSEKMCREAGFEDLFEVEAASAFFVK